MAMVMRYRFKLPGLDRCGLSALPLAVVNQTDEGTMDVMSFVVHFGRLGMATIQVHGRRRNPRRSRHPGIGCNQWLQP